jgi:hypothetical protein
MSTVQTASIPLWLRLLRVIVKSLLSRSVRDEYLAAFDQYSDQVTAEAVHEERQRLRAARGA